MMDPALDDTLNQVYKSFIYTTTTAENVSRGTASL